MIPHHKSPGPLRDGCREAETADATRDSFCRKQQCEVDRGVVLFAFCVVVVLCVLACFTSTLKSIAIDLGTLHPTRLV